MADFYAQVFLVTTGGTRKEAAVEHNEIGEKWRRRPEFTEVYFHDEPSDANKDVEGFGEWTTLYELWFEAADEVAARALIESLLQDEKEWNRWTELEELRAED